MQTFLDVPSSITNVSEEELNELRCALLWSERESSRERGKRKLERIADKRHEFLSPVAQGGLAATAFWSGDYSGAIAWAKRTLARYPMTASAVWCSTLLVMVFRTLGMRRERFEAEGERFRIMRKLAFHGENESDRAYALRELVRELEARDLPEDAERLADELRDLTRSSKSTTPTLYDIRSE